MTDLPRYVCPSSTPRPTDTPVATRTQVATSTPASITTPMCYATYAPTCNSCNYLATPSYRFACPPDPCSLIVSCGSYWLNPIATADPPGFWYGGGVGVGSTATPRPTFTPPATYTPYPTPTPYVVTENYEMGVVGFVLALLLMNVQTVSSQFARNPPCGCGCLFGLVFIGVGFYLLIMGGYWSF